jgi:radical SAM superfamily enzyme YgiQ (UPF0313 family)
MKGHEKNFVPPISGIHLAALTPDRHEVKVCHQQVERVDIETDADLVALSFFTGFAVEAFRLSGEFRRRGKIVIAGGPHVSFSPGESLEHFDSIVTGEAESAWAGILNDFENGKLKRQYNGTPGNLKELPAPRYDLLPERYFIKKVVQATRGCPYHCSFCTVPLINPGFRKRPVDDVIRDITYDNFDHWWQRKIVWFWDDNLTIDRNYIKELLLRMVPLKKWWLTQASIDIARDDELLRLMRRSGCIGIFLGLETFGEGSIIDANKKQNMVSEYRIAVRKLHKYGISVMAGLISGFDHDTGHSIINMARELMKIGVDVPFLSILTPFPGTKIYSQFKDESRLLSERGWNHYNGYNVAFKPAKMSPDELLEAHRKLWKISFSLENSLIRTLRSLFYLRTGSFLLTLFMNGFYGWKGLTGNFPVDMGTKMLSEPFRKSSTHSGFSRVSIRKTVILWK